MDQLPVLTEEVGDFVVSVYYDEYHENPFDDWDFPDTFGIDLSNHRDYPKALCAEFPTDVLTVPEFIRVQTVGYSASDGEELRNEVEALERDCYWLYVYLYDHGGRTVNTTGFSCPWDSGIAGIVYIGKAQYLKEFIEADAELTDDELEEGALEYLVSQVALLDRYMRGNVYGYVVTEKGDPDTQIDACWGFFDDPEYVLKEAKDCLPEVKQIDMLDSIA